MKYSKSQWYDYFNTARWDIIQNDFPVLAFLMRVSTQYSFANGYVNKTITPENNSTVNDTLQVASALGVVVPVIGGALLVISEIFGDINLSVYSEISKSNIAAKRLLEWRDYISSAYGFPINNNLPITSFIQGAKSNCTDLSPLVPKCVSPTNACTTEHIRFQQQVSLIRESQEAVLKIYAQYIDNIESLEADFNKDSVSIPIKLPVDFTKPSTASLGMLGLLAIGLFFSNGS